VERCISVVVQHSLPPYASQQSTGWRFRNREHSLCNSWRFNLFRGQVSSGGSDTALLFTTDNQLQLLRDSHVIYVDSTFRVVSPHSYTLQCGTIMTLISPGDCTLQCGMWRWSRGSEFTKWQHPEM